MLIQYLRALAPCCVLTAICSVCAGVNKAVRAAEGWAIVMFDTEEGATNALAMNGREFGGRNILVHRLGEPPELEEVPVTNSNLACSMAQLGSLQLGAPDSAAGIEAETETVPLSPSASIAPSMESFFVVE